MKYIKGNQTYPLHSEDKTVPTTKTDLVFRGSEGIWVKQGDKEITLLNHSLALYPFPSWGVVFPSFRNSKATYNTRERIDITEFLGSSPDNTVLTLHPEAWDQYIKLGKIDSEGNFIIPQDEHEPQEKSELN